MSLNRFPTAVANSNVFANFLFHLQAASYATQPHDTAAAAAAITANAAAVEGAVVSP